MTMLAPSSRERERDGLADPAVAAGDDGDLALQCHVGVPPAWSRRERAASDRLSDPRARPASANHADGMMFAGRGTAAIACPNRTLQRRRCGMADTYPAIADHGLIGDLQTCALVTTDGAIDWFCAPRFDSPSVFASLLDLQKGGQFPSAGRHGVHDEAALLPRHRRCSSPGSWPSAAWPRSTTSCRSRTPVSRRNGTGSCAW